MAVFFVISDYLITGLILKDLDGSQFQVLVTIPSQRADSPAGWLYRRATGLRGLQSTPSHATVPRPAGLEIGQRNPFRKAADRLARLEDVFQEGVILRHR